MFDREKKDVESVKVGDYLYTYGTHSYSTIVVIKRGQVVKETPKRWKLSNGNYLNKDNLKVVGASKGFHTTIEEYMNKDEIPEHIVNKYNNQQKLLKIKAKLEADIKDIQRTLNEVRGAKDYDYFFQEYESNQTTQTS